jgi:hypothetical protein
VLASNTSSVDIDRKPQNTCMYGFSLEHNGINRTRGGTSIDWNK